LFAGNNSLQRILACFAAVLMLAIGAAAQAWVPGETTLHRPARWLEGVATGVAVHELGHVLTAKATGHGVALDGASIVYTDTLSPADHLALASAGFQAQWLLSETLLSEHEMIDPNGRLSEFKTGMVCGHLIITTAYLVALRNHPQGDIPGMSQASGVSRDKLMLYVAVPAALDTWRLLGKNVPNWVPRLSMTMKGIGIYGAWGF